MFIKYAKKCLVLILIVTLTISAAMPVMAKETSSDENGKSLFVDETKRSGDDSGNQEGENDADKPGNQEGENDADKPGNQEGEKTDKEENGKPAKADWNADGALKILMVGNSYSIDTMQYVHSIAQNLGVANVKLGVLYIASCHLTKHLSNARSDAASYTYYTNTDGSWTSQANYRMKDAVLSDNWDYISFQQASASSGVPRTYDDLAPLLEIVEGWCPTAKYVWNMTWAYQKDTERVEYNSYVKNQNIMYEAIVSTVQEKILTNEKIDQVIPVGTAVQNARTTYLGDTVTRDGYHLSYDIGRYIAGVAFFHNLTGISVDGLTYIPSGTGTGICAIARESAKNASKNPFSITTSEYSDAYKTGYYNTYGMDICVATGGAHVESTAVVAATTKADGTITPTCAKCHTLLPVRTIPHISSVSLSKTEYNYNGKKKTPSVTVLDSMGAKLTKDTDYTVTYGSGCKNVGKYGVTITYKGNYSGSKTLYFTILPKTTKITKTTAKKNQITIKWNKISAQRTGYQIQYSKKSNFSSKKSVKIKTNTTSTTIKKLTKNKKYYIRIRTYKTINSKTYYSAWSAVKSVKTKK